MASRESVVKVLKAMPPDANAATIDYRSGGSTPGEQYMVWDFDPTTVEYMDFLCYLDGYNSGGLTFTIPWSADGTNAGNVEWEIGIRAIPDDAEDVDIAHVYQYNNVVDAAPSVDGEVVYPTIAFTDGADMDDWADGELAIVRIKRDTSVGSNMAADAQLWHIIGLET
jgi:hypothetical protein